MQFSPEVGRLACTLAPCSLYPTVPHADPDALRVQPADLLDPNHIEQADGPFGSFGFDFFKGSPAVSAGAVLNQCLSIGPLKVSTTCWDLPGATHWQRQPWLIARIVAAMIGATTVDILSPVFAGRLVDATGLLDGDREATHGARRSGGDPGAGAGR